MRGKTSRTHAPERWASLERHERIAEANRRAHGICTREPSLDCADPYCDELGGHGLFGNFCKEHAARLAAIREDFQKRARRKGYHRRRDVSGSTREATCCNEGCENTRKSGSPFCPSCTVEEDA